MPVSPDEPSAAPPPTESKLDPGAQPTVSPKGASDELAALASALDRRLVAEVLAGDREAFRGLVERHQSRIFHLAKSLVRNRADAADIAQETFVRAYGNLKSYRAEGSFTSWLSKIANNLSIDFLRRQKTQAPIEFDDALAETASEETHAGLLAARTRSDPQSSALRHELGSQLEAALAQLPEKHRAILLLRELDGLSYEELSQVLEIPVGTVMSRLFHARSKMQALLTSYLEADGSTPHALHAANKPGPVTK